MKPYLIIVILSLIGLMLTNSSDNNERIEPDLLIVNATIHTMDSSRPNAEAVAILGDRIVAVGTDQDIRKLAGARTRVIDAGKQLVLPGFNDAHVHFMTGGFQLSSVDLRDATSGWSVGRMREAVSHG